jgi:hypothetical protein
MQGDRSGDPTPQEASRELDGFLRQRDHEIRSLRDTLYIYRTGASALATRNAGLRAELAILRRELDAHGGWADPRVVEAWLGADGDDEQLVFDAVAGALGADLPSGTVEDAMLIASTLAAGAHATRAGAALLRVVRAAGCVRLELEETGTSAAVIVGPPEHGQGHAVDLGLIQLLCDRSGAERTASGQLRVWAQIDL